MSGEKKWKRRTKGYWFWKKEWYSICSRHREYDEGCNLCNAGSWVSVYGNVIEGWFYKMFPELWKRWMNRKGNPRKKLLQKFFPNLK